MFGPTFGRTLFGPSCACGCAPPEGMRYGGTQLRTEHWAAPTPGRTPPVLHGYDANRFSTFHWEVNSFQNRTLQFGRGGNQAGQGVYTMAELFVENILYELDHVKQICHDPTQYDLIR